MMGMPNYKSKAALKRAINSSKPPVARLEFEETSILGPEYKGAGTYTVVMGPARGARRSFGQVTVNADGHIVGVK
jgi:hypothetical protein